MSNTDFRWSWWSSSWCQMIIGQQPIQYVWHLLFDLLKFKERNIWKKTNPKRIIHCYNNTLLWLMPIVNWTWFAWRRPRILRCLWSLFSSPLVVGWPESDQREPTSIRDKRNWKIVKNDLPLSDVSSLSSDGFGGIPIRSEKYQKRNVKKNP